jgi:SAM-dependent methyltransferase
VSAPPRPGGAPEPAGPRDVIAHYEERLARFGPTARGMDWRDEASQRLRFEVLCGVAELRGRRVHEVGCGVGHLCDFLRERGIEAEYSGSDASPAMLEAARRLHPGVSFELRDVLAEVAPGSYDVVLASGLFHVKLGHPEDAWREFLRAGLRRMYAACRRAIAFNLMSDQVEFRSPALYYAAPAEVLDFCRRELSRHVVLRHDYPLHEHTTYVYRHPRSG